MKMAGVDSVILALASEDATKKSLLVQNAGKITLFNQAAKNNQSRIMPKTIVSIDGVVDR
jgi:hypothetical protein